MSTWYVVVPPGGVLLVDGVELREAVTAPAGVRMTDAEKRARLAAATTVDLGAHGVAIRRLRVR